MRLLALLSFTLFANASAASDLSLNYIGAHSIATGTTFQGAPFGGISGIEHIEGNRYYAISDARGGKHGRPRFYELAIDYDASAIHNVTIEKKHDLIQPSGKLFAKSKPTVDPESLRLAPNGNFYWTSEGNFSRSKYKRRQPFLYESTPSGKFVRSFQIPTQFNYKDGKKTGGRNNKLFEALTVAQDGTVFIMNEDALAQDAPAASQKQGTYLRLTALDPNNGKYTKQYAYELPRIPTYSKSNKPHHAYPPVNGVSEILSIGDNKFITLERAFTGDEGFTIRLVETEIKPYTSDIKPFKTLQKGAYYKPLPRKVLLEMPPYYRGLKTDNIEGITWGKTLANGNRTLILVSDNNFSSKQTTMFIAFEVEEIQ